MNLCKIGNLFRWTWWSSSDKTPVRHELELTNHTILSDIFIRFRKSSASRHLIWSGLVMWPTISCLGTCKYVRSVCKQDITYGKSLMCSLDHLNTVEEQMRWGDEIHLVEGVIFHVLRSARTRAQPLLWIFDEQPLDDVFGQWSHVFGEGRILFCNPPAMHKTDTVSAAGILQSKTCDDEGEGIRTWRCLCGSSRLRPRWRASRQSEARTSARRGSTSRPPGMHESSHPWLFT